jgi:hypothetical protein
VKSAALDEWTSGSSSERERAKGPFGKAIVEICIINTKK